MAPNQRHPPEQATKTHTKSRVLKKLILRQDCNSGSGSTVKDVKTSSWKQKKTPGGLGGEPACLASSRVSIRAKYSVDLPCLPDTSNPRPQV